MHKKLIFIASIIILSSVCSYTQSFVFGPQIGSGLGNQKWNGIDRDPAILLNAGMFIETYDEEAPSSIFAYLGYNQRGSSQRIVGNGFSETNKFLFNNLALQLGFKGDLKLTSEKDFYYKIGLRAEYTINTNLDQYNNFGGYFPVNEFANKFNYGAYAAVGYQMPFSEFVGAHIEFSVSPDLSIQYQQPALTNVIDPFFGGSRNIPEQEIRNLTFEITLGLRLLRKVIIID